VEAPVRGKMGFRGWALAAPAMLAGCSAQEAPRPDPLVATAVVGTPADAPGLRLNGVVAARVDTVLAFRVPGQITGRVVQRGQMVRRGQPLLQLDAADLALSASEAAAQSAAAASAVTAARAAATRARSDEARQRGLVAAGSVSAQAYDAIRAAADAAQAELAATEARATAAAATAARAGNQRRYATLVADADGIVTNVLVEPGQQVQAGTPAVTLARAGGREIRVTVPEFTRAALRRAGAVTVAAAGRTFPATLVEVSAAADPVTRSFEARYALAGGDALLPGLTASIDLSAGGRGARAVAVPLAAIIDRGRGPAVWIVGRDRRLARRAIAIAAITDNQARIARGLVGGERIVIAGAHLLSAGQRVRIGSLPQ
jgi:RND family efflux transporter MFP subunit